MSVVQVAGLLDGFCRSSNCSATWTSHWNQFVLSCGGAVPHPSLLQIPEANYRAMVAIFTLPCLNESTPANYSGVIFPQTHCWPHLHRISMTQIDTVTLGDLVTGCTTCLTKIYSAIAPIGAQPLIVGARLANTFCLALPPTYAAPITSPYYCALILQAARKSMAGQSSAIPTAATFQAATFDSLCNPCLRTAVYEQLRSIRLLNVVAPAQYAATGGATTEGQLVNVTSALTLGCAKDLRADSTGTRPYCLQKVLGLGDLNAILALLSPCLNALGTGTCPADCDKVLADLWTNLGCCMGTFIRSAQLASPGVAAQAQLILEPCKRWPLPQVCTNKIMTITVPFSNVASSYIAKDTTGVLVNSTCSAINADPLDIKDVSCAAAGASVTCTAHVWADTDDEAVARVAYFNAQVAMKTVRLLTADVGVSLDDRTDPTMPAYSAASITATADPACEQFAYPVSYSYNAKTGTCDQNPPNSASALSIHAIVYLAVAALLVFLL